jgi:hypothetical protein
MRIKELLDTGYDVTVDVWNKKNRIMKISEVKLIIHVIFNWKVPVKIHRKSYVGGIPRRIKRKYYIATGNSKIMSVLIGECEQFIRLKRYPGYRASRMRKMYIEEYVIKSSTI